MLLHVHCPERNGIAPPSTSSITYAAREGTISHELEISPDTLDKLEEFGHKVDPFITQTSIQSIKTGPDGFAY